MHPKKPQLEVIDPAFEEDLKDFIDAVLDEEKKEFQPGIESFEVHASKIRQEISDAMHEFQKNYRNGYLTVCEKLQEQGITPPEVDEDQLAIFDDPVEFMDALESGQAIYQLLGFSSEVMTQFYEVGATLAEENDFAKARDVFYFLVTIAPDISSFWLGLGMCNAKIQNYEKSLMSYRRSIAINPHNPDAYLGACHAAIKLGFVDEAIALSDEGLLLAKDHSSEPWAEELAPILEEAKKYVTSQHKI